MDANGQKFWMLSDGAQADGDALWDVGRRVFRLPSRRPRPLLANDRTAARTAASRPTITMDSHNTWAQISPTRQSILAGGATPGTIEIFSAADPERINDIAFDGTGILYILLENADNQLSSVVWLDRRDRFTPHAVSLDVAYDRLLPREDGSCFLLNTSTHRCALATGQPLPDDGIRYHPQTTRPSEENPAPPTVSRLPDITLPAALEIISATVAENQLLLLCWEDNDNTTIARIQQQGEVELHSLGFMGAPFDISICATDRLALLHTDSASSAHEAPVLQRTPDGWVLLGERYPVTLGGAAPARFANNPYPSAHYIASPATNTDTAPDSGLRLRQLLPLSIPTLSRSGTVQLNEPFDSGGSGTVWHRIYVEAKIPPGCTVQVHLAATEELETATDFAPHLFGTNKSAQEIVQGSWVPQASEIAFHEGLLDYPSTADHTGLFSALVQVPARAVRDLTGRYLHLVLELTGNGHVSPEVAAVRVYGPRFSYRDRYLPEIYHESLSRAQAQESADATGADFLQRLLGLFEGVLTPLEDRIANAYLLTNPETTPGEALDWLGHWVGLTLEPGLSESVKRRLIKNGGTVYRHRGTLLGLSKMLDIVSDNAVANGQIVIIEEFRLRRTLATILGADFTREHDALFQDTLPSTNSYLGETLFLGEETGAEFERIFMQELTLDDPTLSSVQALEDFFARLAQRITILVHREMSPSRQRLIQTVIEQEAPAHLEVRLVAAGEPLLVGMRSLTGVNTYLNSGPEDRSIIVGEARVGRHSILERTGALDSRLQRTLTGEQVGASPSGDAT